jgi:predicted AlkP superfamily pyrophosphatase or phosphodiesterase
MKKLSFLLLIAFAIQSCKTEKTNPEPYVVMLSLDGFRWDYPQHMNTPVLDSLKKAGVIAESLKPSFPSKTFPNHYTIATGLYPDHHGIVENSFYAPDLGKYYEIRDRDAVENGEFYGGEPIWVTAEKQNVKSATLFWVGSEAEIKGYRPSIWYQYDHDIPYRSRVDSLVRWLSLPENERPHLIMWYIFEPDHTGHKFGPYGEETKEVVENLDSLLGYYFTQMRKLPIFNQINFIVTSDHGMAETSMDRRIIIDEQIDTADIEYMGGWNPDFNLKVKPGKLDKVFKRLKNTPHIYVWKHDSLPKRLHYGTNPRTLDLTIVAYPGWAIASTWKPKTGHGAHGYDNDFKDMHAIFYAAGPAFKRNYVEPTFENVNIYPLIADILKLKPAKTDGNLENVEGMLKKKY